MHQGWSVQGIRCFNVLYDLVEKERETQAGFMFEEDFLLYMQEKKNNSKKKESKNNEYELCRHDLWAMRDGINDVSTAAAVLESGHYKSSYSLFENNSGYYGNNTDDDNNEDLEENEDNCSSASSVGFKHVVGI